VGERELERRSPRAPLTYCPRGSARPTADAVAKLFAEHSGGFGQGLRWEWQSNSRAQSDPFTLFSKRTSTTEGRWRAGWSELNVNETKPASTEAH